MASAEVFKAGYVINDRFEISRLLGQGGFAMVFEGTDRNLGRKVAIKILHGAVLKSSADDHRVIERFEREAKLAASVDHPSVVNIYDAGEIDGLGEPFIVMEYLKGDSLQDYLDNNGPIAPDRLLPLFKDVLMGLGYSHELGIVHKDLKPDNIFYRYPDSMRESLCIVDFGIAHIGRSNSGRVTRDGEFFGTPSYMPPEYIAEQKVSAAFDVYQMGLILIECLTGQSVVYHEDAVATLLMHLNRKFRIPTVLLESEAWPVIERAIAANPSLRYKNALGFAEALHSLPASAWPSRDELAAVEIVQAEIEPPAPLNDGLGDPDTEVEDIEVADVWKQEDSFRTTGSNDVPTSSGKLPLDVMPYEPSGDYSAHAKVDRAARVAAPRFQVDSTEEVPYADGSPSLVDTISQQKSSRLAMIAGAVLVLVVLAGGAIATLAGDPSKPDGTPGDEIKAAVVSQETLDSTLTAPEEIEESVPVVAVEEPPEPKVEPPIPQPVQVTITGTPSGARVTDLSGKILGKTPMPLSFESDQDKGRVVIVSLNGYQEFRLTVDPSLVESGARYELEKIRKQPSTKKPPAKQPDKTPVQPVEKPPEKTPLKVELPGNTPRKNGGTGILLPR